MGIHKNGAVLAFTGAELAQMDKEELANVVEDGVVFARVAPEQKLRLVEALQSKGDRVGRILAISLFNWIVIFGVFFAVCASSIDQQWWQQVFAINLSQIPSDTLALARTMVINALIAGRIFYMLSISQLIPNLIAKMDGTMEENVDIPAIGFGIIGAVIFQIVFTHVLR